MTVRIAQPPNCCMRSMTRLGGGVGELVDDRPVAEEHDPIGVAAGDGVVGDHDDRLRQIVDGLRMNVEDLGAGPRVEVPGGLVGEDRSAGRRGQRPRHRDTLLLATRQLGRPVRQAVGADPTVSITGRAIAGRACGPASAVGQRDVLDAR